MRVTIASPHLFAALTSAISALIHQVRATRASCVRIAPKGLQGGCSNRSKRSKDRKIWVIPVFHPGSVFEVLGYENGPWRTKTTKDEIRRTSSTKTFEKSGRRRRCSNARTIRSCPKARRAEGRSREQDKHGPSARRSTPVRPSVGRPWALTLRVLQLPISWCPESFNRRRARGGNEKGRAFRGF